MKLEEIIKELQSYKKEIRERYGIIILGIFGSFARGEQKESSDVDILVDLEKPIGFNFFKLWDELEEKLQRKVDLVTLKSLREEIKEDILKEIVKI